MEIDELKKLYLEESKHSNYQILSRHLSQLVGHEGLEVKSRYEAERLEYILRNINVKGKRVLDIGGNTGFFTFELIENGVLKVHYYEGNKTHAKFVTEAAKLLDVEERIKITEEYFAFDGSSWDKYDLVLLLNILHHVGDDYGDKGLGIEKAKEEILRQLNALAELTDQIVFQIGFNWKGNIANGLFKEGTKREMISFIEEGTKEYWKIIQIGIAERRNNRICYYDVNEKNIYRVNELGEFLNRPIFIMKSIK